MSQHFKKKGVLYSEERKEYSQTMMSKKKQS